MRGKRRWLAWFLILFLIIYPVQELRAEEDKENDSLYGWYTDERTGKKYFYDRNGELHYGWLRYQGSWYYFTPLGNMVESGYRSIDNKNYFFYNSGRLATGTYLGLHYINENGLREEEHDIRLVGRGEVTMYDKDMISDALYYVPSKWVLRFVKDGWQIMFYTKKAYMEAPDTDLGVYYMNYKLDTAYKKLKFTDPDDIVRGFGEYIGYALGLYQEGNVQMEAMWRDEIAIAELAELPDYYVDDPGFYFGILCKLFWDPETAADLEAAAPDTYAILKELIQ
ncbi:hypothetical protein AALB16_03560 [Lachnospiraceae bacterium 62-35]